MNESRPVLGFYWHGKSIWADQPLNNDAIDEIMIGVYHFYEDGSKDGTTGEFSIRWEMLGEEPVAELRLYHDAWPVFVEHQATLMNVLSGVQGTNPSPGCVFVALKKAGLVDLTPRSQQEYNRPPNLPWLLTDEV